MNRRLVQPIALLALAGAPAAVSAQESAPGPRSAEDAPVRWPWLKDPDAFTVQIQPRFWYTSPAGKIRLPSTTTRGDTVKINDLGLDEPRISPFGEIRIRADAWRFTISGANYNIDHAVTAGSGFQLGNVSVSPGDTVHTEYDLTVVQASVGYRFWTKDFGADGGGEPDRTVLRLEGVGGLRVIDNEITFMGMSDSSHAAEFFAEPFVGADAELQVARDFSIDVGFNAGALPLGSHSTFSVDMSLAFTWRPVEAVGLQIGWRQLLFGLKTGSDAGEFSNRGSLAGLFGGLVIRF